MRLGAIIVAAGLAAIAWSASAQNQDASSDHYYAALSQECPDKQLQLLSSAQLRDGLDQYVEGLPQDAQDEMRRAERAQCSSLSAGVACVNAADLAVVERMNLTGALASSVCLSFLRCRAQGDCDAAR